MTDTTPAALRALAEQLGLAMRDQFAAPWLSATSAAIDTLRALAAEKEAARRDPSHAWPALDRLLIDAWKAGADGRDLDLIECRKMMQRIDTAEAARDARREALEEAMHIASLYGQGKQGIATSEAIQKAIRALIDREPTPVVPLDVAQTPVEGGEKP